MALLEMAPGATEFQAAVICGLNDKQYRAWQALATAGAAGHCRPCLDDALDGAIGKNGSTLLRELRNLGFGIPRNPKYRSGVCPTHPKAATWDYLLDPLPKISDARSRAAYSDKEWKTIVKTLGDRDAYTGVTAERSEVDHRVPWARTTGDEQKVDVTNLDEIRERYMTLSSAHNSLKERRCNECITTGQRPAFNDINFWYEGNETYTDEVGCNGCGWAHPEKWKASLNKLIAPAALPIGPPAPRVDAPSLDENRG